jgi:hypothetical protein
MSACRTRIGEKGSDPFIGSMSATVPILAGGGDAEMGTVPLVSVAPVFLFAPRGRCGSCSPCRLRSANGDRVVHRRSSGRVRSRSGLGDGREARALEHPRPSPSDRGVSGLRRLGESACGDRDGAARDRSAPRGRRAPRRSHAPLHERFASLRCESVRADHELHRQHARDRAGRSAAADRVRTVRVGATGVVTPRTLAPPLTKERSRDSASPSSAMRRPSASLVVRPVRVQTAGSLRRCARRRRRLPWGA